MFELKTWLDRVCQFPARRKLTPTGSDGEYDVSLADGEVMVEGDTFDAATMNDLESRIAAGFEAVTVRLMTVTVPADGWTSGEYAVTWDDGTSTSYAYRNRVTVEGVTADSRLAVSQRTQPTDAVCRVAALEPGAGVVDFYADSAVSADAVFVVEVTAG